MQHELQCRPFINIPRTDKKAEANQLELFSAHHEVVESGLLRNIRRVVGVDYLPSAELVDLFTHEMITIVRCRSVTRVVVATRRPTHRESVAAQTTRSNPDPLSLYAGGGGGGGSIDLPVSPTMNNRFAINLGLDCDLQLTVPINEDLIREKLWLDRDQPAFGLPPTRV